MGLFWGFVISVSCDPGRPRDLSGLWLTDFRHLFSCWRRPGIQVRCNHLKLQVEREGSMDWLSLLIPLKLVVFCVILVVIYRMMSGWNSIQTPEAPGRSASRVQLTLQLGVRPPGSFSQSLKLLNSPSCAINIVIKFIWCPTGRRARSSSLLTGK